MMNDDDTVTTLMIMTVIDDDGDHDDDDGHNDDFVLINDDDGLFGFTHSHSQASRAPTATVFAAPEGCQASSNDDNPATTAIRQGTRYDDAC